MCRHWNTFSLKEEQHKETRYNVYKERHVFCDSTYMRYHESSNSSRDKEAWLSGAPLE